jgi:nucleotide-binding universal stress UspA family protein
MKVEGARRSNPQVSLDPGHLFGLYQPREDFHGSGNVPTPDDSIGRQPYRPFDPDVGKPVRRKSEVMHRILSAVDMSAHGTTVMDYSLFIAGAFHASITGLCVVETKKIEGPTLRDYLATVGLSDQGDYRAKVERFLGLRATEILGSFEERCRQEGVRFEGVSRKGILSRVIASMVDDIDLILLGRKGEHAEWHAHPLGSSVEAVIRTTRKPVLVTPKRFAPIQRALVAYDGSQYSKDALEMAAQISRETRMEGLVLAVQSEEEASRRLAVEVTEALTAHEVEYEFLARSGDAGEVIPATAVDRDCQLIVMGAYGHTKIREMILGSTTERVLLNAPDLAILVKR